MIALHAVLGIGLAYRHA